MENMFSAVHGTAASPYTWYLSAPAGEMLFSGPLYRGAFDVNEDSPKVLRLAIKYESPQGAIFKIRSGALERRVPFAVSVDIDPEIWNPIKHQNSWYFFESGHALLALWCSVPVSWLGENPDGTAVPPPWRELWSFGTVHCWYGRLGEPGDTQGFIRSCVEFSPIIPPKRHERRICASSLY